MKYALYLILLYIMLPLNTVADFIVIMLFFIALNEHAYFAILYAFIAGLLVDLYYPSLLGFNMLFFIVLVQILLIIITYITRTPIMLFALFSVFFLVKVTIHHIIVAFDTSILFIILTIILFFPVFGLLNRIVYRTWMKT